MIYSKSNCDFVLQNNPLRWECSREGCRRTVVISFSFQLHHIPRALCKVFKNEFVDVSEPLSSGSGTELKSMLSRRGIFPAGNCGCNALASIMDREGPDWCERNADYIVERMLREASNRPLLSKIPKVIAASELHQLLNAAIRTTRKKLKRQEK